MKKLKIPNLKRLLLAIPFVAGALLTQAQPAWDVQGNWDLWFEIQDGFNPYPIDITNEDFVTGSFSGTAGGGSYQISGSVSGSSIQFSDPVIGGYGGGFTGNIATNGTLGGDMWYNNGHGLWYGFWGTSSGQAIQYSAPQFTLQPVSQVINAGQPVTFTAMAAGYPPVTYQWQFNGTNITNGTNSSFTLSSTEFANLGIYDVVAFNSVGTNVSMLASLSFLNVKCFPGLILYGPVGVTYTVQAAPMGGTNWTTITNVTLTSSQPYIFVDYGSITNNSEMYIAIPQ